MSLFLFRFPTRSAGQIVSLKAPLPSFASNQPGRYHNKCLGINRLYNTGKIVVFAGGRLLVHSAIFIFFIGPTQFHRVEIQKPPRSRFRRFVGFVVLAGFSYWLGSGIEPVRTAWKIMTTSPITNEESLTLFQPSDELSQSIESHIQTHPLALKYRNDPAFTEARPHMKVPQEMRGRHLITGALLGPKRVVVPPLVFQEKSGKELIAIMYLGQEVCGHPGIVHGGLLATMLDEGLARCCFPVLPNHIGVTANLTLDYKKPVMADRFIVLRATTVKYEGRKAWVEGRIESLPEGDEEPVVLVEAKGLFVEPKYAAVGSRNSITGAIETS